MEQWSNEPTNKSDQPVLVVSAGCVPRGLVDGLGGGLGRPGDALDDVVVVAHLDLDVLAARLPHPHRLVVAAAGQQVPVQGHAHHPHPLSGNKEIIISRNKVLVLNLFSAHNNTTGRDAK